MGAVLIVLAAGFGATAGWLLPRAAYRLSVEPGEPWRDRCPERHRVRGWLGPARCRVAAGVLVRGSDTPPPAAAAPHVYGRRAAPLAVLVGALCAGLGAAVGVRPEVLVYVGLAPVVVLLALVDRAVHRLPDVLTLPLAAGAAALLGVAALLPRAGGDWRLALLGGGALGAAYLLLHLINPAGMGFGDVKLALSLGVALGWYGWGVWAAGAFLGLLYGALYGLTLLLRGSGTREQGFAFGPFMAAGALTGVLLGGFGA
ncbi:A24 family peptidase [Streptomyces sp. NPDC001581]|uniref:A24 family peptidase n=1 Tax=Streptomyces sp. NPDC001581 TaxID=3154386 RepID=UPI0033177C4C